MVAQNLVTLFFSYGLIGLFLSSLFSALFFIPGFSDLLIPVYVGLKFNPFLIFIFVTAGGVLGGAFNYYVGFLGARYIKVKISHKKYVQNFLKKWGDFSVLIMSVLPPPFPFDLVTVVLGFLKMDFKTFIISTTIGKSIKHALFILISIYGIEALLKILAAYGVG
jgi:membrane protein YqaA with SNARE-associated domain